MAHWHCQHTTGSRQTANISCAASQLTQLHINMASNVPNVLLNNGKSIPILGLGTWNVSALYSFFVCVQAKKSAQSCVCAFIAFLIFLLCVCYQYVDDTIASKQFRKFISSHTVAQG